MKKEMNKIIKGIHSLESLNVDQFRNLSSLLDESKLFFEEAVTVERLEDVDIYRVLIDMALLEDSSQQNREFSRLIDRLQSMPIGTVDFI